MSYLERLRREEEAREALEGGAEPLIPGKTSLTSRFPAVSPRPEKDEAQRQLEQGLDITLTGPVSRAAPADDSPPPGFAYLAQSFGGALGVSPTLDAGASGAATARDHGTIAVARGNTVSIDADAVDPESSEGRRVVAHEMVHIAQGQLGGSSWGEHSIEAEAHRAGDRLATGNDAGVLHAARDSYQAAAWHLPGTPAPEHELSPDGFLIEGRQIRIERGWYEHHYGPGAAAANRTAANRLILQRLSESSMPWIRDLPPADLENAVTHLDLDVGDWERNDVATRPIFNSVYRLVGLPPGTNVLWDFPSAAVSSSPPPPPPTGDGPPPPPPPPPRTAQLMVRASADTNESGGSMSAPLATEALDRLELRVGAVLLPGVREDVVSSGRLGVVESTGLANIHHPLPRAEMIRVFGEGAWVEFERRLSGTGAIASDDATGAGELADPGIPAEEQQFARRMLEEIFAGPATGGSSRITAALLAVLHEIDQHPQRARILEALRAPGGTPATGELAATLRQTMQSVDMGAEYDRLGIRPGTGEARARTFPWPVQGRIINHTDLLFTGKEAAFSVDVTSPDVPPLMMTVPWVNVHWVVRATSNHDTSAPIFREGHTDHRHRLDPPENFEISFDRVGTYEINALVDHDNFAPNHFTIFVEVQTEDQRFAEVQDRAFSPGLWGDVDPASRSATHPFPVSTGDVHSTGVTYEGAMPTECVGGMVIPGHLEGIDARITQVQGYIDSGRLDAAGISWANDYLTQLRSARARIQSELDGGAHLVYVQGAYLSRAEGATSQALSLVATAQHSAAGWVVSIHDTTQAFDARNSRFDCSPQPTYRGAAELVFTDLCKSYPRGRMSVRMELLDEATGQPTNRFVGFELECDSTWEAVRRVAYNPVVSGVINIAGTCVALFVPPSAAFIIPTLIAYNAVDTVGTVIDLGARDALTWRDGAIAAAQIAIDVIPYVGRATRIISVGSRAYRVMEGLETAGEILLMTAQAEEQVQSIRMGVVRQAAEVHAQIQALEASNPSDPELPRLRAQFGELQLQATNAWATVGLEMAAQQGLMRMSMHTLHSLHAAHVARVDASRTALTDAAAARGGEVLQAGDRPHIETAMGVRVSTWEGGGDGVRIVFDAHPLGGISNVRLEVGPNASLTMVMRHERTMTAMRRYEGAAGSLRNLLERVGAWTRGGGHIPPHSRAFEARFELQKLPPMIESMRAELASHALDDASRARLEQQASALEQQLAAHAGAFDDLAPGLGYVAAADTGTSPVASEGGDTGATMGTHPGSAVGTTPLAHTTGTPVPPPHGRAPEEHARLAARRGSDRVPLATADRRSSWTARDEAMFRWGNGAGSVPDGYHWSSDGTGTPVLARDVEVGADGSPTPRRALDTAAAARGETDPALLFPVRSDAIELAGYHTSGDFTDPAFHASPEARATMDALAESRRLAISRRTDSEARVTRLANELGVNPDDLSGSGAQAIIDRLRHDGGDAARMAKIEELAAARGLLTDARRDLTRASERLGNRMAMDYMAQRHSAARRVHPGDAGLDAAGRPGELDFIYVIGTPPNHSVIIVEAKGASSGLGSRDAGPSGRAQQGTPTYLDSVARAMRDATTDPAMGAILDSIINRDTMGTEVHYVLIEAPVGETTTAVGTGGAATATSGGAVRDGRVSEFRL